MAKQEQIFPNLNEVVDSDEPQVTEIESYCVECGKDGTTRLLLTEIPFFRQVVLMSFACPHCHYQNNELQPAQQIGERGVRYELKVLNVDDLKRQVIKTEWAEISIPEIEFSVSKQTGLITTVEGLLDRAITGLRHSWGNNEDVEFKQKLQDYIEKMVKLMEGKETFTLIVEDMSGNSFVENPLAPEPDPQLTVSHYIRTIDEDKLLGIYANEENDQTGGGSGDPGNLKDEVLQFPTNCPHCNAPCFTNMKLTNIPHFKEIIIMATNCDACGTRTNEIKSGAGIEDKGVRITLNVQTDEDLKREVVRSDTCNVEIPELHLQLHSSGSGRYTTIQGLGLNMIDDLQQSNPFIDGDSTPELVREKLAKLSERLTNLLGTTLILDDPCGNSFVEGATDVVHYERSYEQNEELGLNDIKTDNYQPLEGVQEEKEEEEETKEVVQS